ncbi:MAG: hypothetical protein M1503_11295 [Thaumarchaeota archaeon]|nr:hypothetical protein [Nitrososphaerota archaeon]
MLSREEVEEIEEQLAFIGDEDLSIDPIRACRAERLLTKDIPRLITALKQAWEALDTLSEESLQMEAVVQASKRIFTHTVTLKYVKRDWPDTYRYIEKLHEALERLEEKYE